MNASQNKLLVLGFLISMVGTSGCLAVGALDRAALEDSGNLQVAGDDDEGGDGEAPAVVVAEDDAAVLEEEEEKAPEKAKEYPLFSSVGASCTDADPNCSSKLLTGAMMTIQVYAGECASVAVGKSAPLAAAEAEMSCVSAPVGKTTVTTCSASASDLYADKTLIKEVESEKVCYVMWMDDSSGAIDSGEMHALSDVTLTDEHGAKDYEATLSVAK